MGGVDQIFLWNLVLTGMVGIIGFMLKQKFDELAKLHTLINRTREEIARDHVTRRELNESFDKLLERIDALSSKLDAVVMKHQS